MEAMRLSMLEHEEQQKREAEARKKAEQQQGSVGEVSRIVDRFHSTTRRNVGAETRSIHQSSIDPSGGFIQPRPASNTSSSASSMRNMGAVPAPQSGAPSGPGHVSYNGLLAQPAESSPLSGTPITRSETDVSHGAQQQQQRPDLINLDSDAAIVTTTQRSQ